MYKKIYIQRTRVISLYEYDGRRAMIERRINKLKHKSREEARGKPGDEFCVILQSSYPPILRNDARNATFCILFIRLVSVMFQITFACRKLI